MKYTVKIEELETVAQSFRESAELAVEEALREGRLSVEVTDENGVTQGVVVMLETVIECVAYQKSVRPRGTPTDREVEERR